MNAIGLRRTALVCIGLALAGCETSDIAEKVQESVHDFNPFGTAKKKLPGTRKPLFPEGVPGVQQGVPPDLLVGAQPQDASPSPAAQPTLAETPAKPKASARRKARTAAPVQREARPAEPAKQTRANRRPPQPAGPTSGSAAQPAPGWPEPAAPAAAPRAPAAPAPPPTAGPLPGSEPVPTIWPDPPKAGTFSR